MILGVFCFYSIANAEALNISERTVEGHRYNISKKTKTNNPMDLIEYALKNGLNEV